jgi:Zn-dependent protease with chaperone function
MRFFEQQRAARQSTAWLLGLFALVVAVLVLAVNAALWLVWQAMPFASFTGLPDHFWQVNTFVVLLFVLGSCWVESSNLSSGGGAYVARKAGGREVTAPQNLRERQLLNVVQEMAIAAAMKPPAVFVLPREDAINAFAAGWSPDEAAVAVTQGALERLTRDELQGVMAHEFSHVANGDMRLNMRLIGLTAGIELISRLGAQLLSANERGQRSALSVVGVALWVVGWVGWMGARLIKAAVSRQREYLADASAVRWTRQADGIGGALRKIARQAAQGRATIAHPSAVPFSHLYLASVNRSRWFSSHPPIAERLQAIYGHVVPPLDDAPVPEPSAEAEPAFQGFVGFAPNAAVSPSGISGGLPTSPQDPLCQAEAAEAHTARRDAIARLTALAGPSELQVALLGLWCGYDATAGSGRQLHERLNLQAWETLAPATLQRALIATDLQALDDATRWALAQTWRARLALHREAGIGFEALVQRLAKADQVVSLREWLLWRWWRHDALAFAGEAANTPTAWSYEQQAFPHASSIRQTLPHLLSMPPMQKPLIVKRWLAESDSLPRDTPAEHVAWREQRQCLRILAVLMDTPNPPGLASAYSADLA